MNVDENLSWALTYLATAQGCVLDPLRLKASLEEESLQRDPYESLVGVCGRLALDPPQRLSIPDAAYLPLLCLTNAHGWGVIIDRQASGVWRVVCREEEISLSNDEVRDRSVLMRCEPHSLGFDENEEILQGGFRGQLKAALRLNRGPLIEACLASAFIAFLALATSLFSMQVYDRVIPTRSETTLFVLAAGVFFSVMIELAMKLARSHLMDHVVVGVDSRLSRAIFQRLLLLRVDQVPASVGSLASQLRGYEQVRAFYTSSTLFTLIDLPIAALFIVVVVLLATPLIGGVILAFGLVAILVGIANRRKIRKLAKEGAAYANMKTGLLVEAVEGVETIKSGSGGWRFLSRWIKVNQFSIQADLKMRRTSESTTYMAATLQQLSYAGLILAGALVVMQGQMTTGALVACSILSGRILSPILALPGMLTQHAHAKVAEEGLEQLYKLKIDNDGVARPLLPERLSGNFTLTDVTFAYGDNPPAFNARSLRIAAGERIAILGPIGAGKSTLLRLLSGLYVPQQGRVLLDGLDLSHISRQIVSRQVGYLQQDHRLFQGTLRENLLIGLPDPGDEVILQVMRRTGMDRIVAAHPKGLDRPIMEGGKGLSGGQKQLVAFTRLILCNPSILLLDEPTASMDDEQEKQCLAVLAQEAKFASKTMIIVTHKPSIMPLVSRIIIVAGTGIVMDGPRDVVLRQLEGKAKARHESAGSALAVVRT